jgi:GntR family transcriptional regulator, transcriptional repressor for pyruvate dehydrogenase complex
MTANGIGVETRRRLTARRTAEIVAEELRRHILDGELVDGDLLPRHEVLVERFKVSLVSLGEALRILETEGLVSVRRGNRDGAVVHAPAKASAAYMLGLVLQSHSVPLTDLGHALQEIEPSCAMMAAHRPDRISDLVPELIRLNTALQVLRTFRQLLGAVGFCDECDVSVIGRHLRPLLRMPLGREELAVRLSHLSAGHVETPFTESA